MAESTLELSNICSGYSSKEVLHNITLQITEPSIYVVLGPNGAGKTTLLRTIGGILEPFKGTVTYAGQNVHTSREARAKMCYLSHLNALPEEMTVYNALRFYQGIEGGDVDSVIEKLTLRDLQTKKLTDLSQGQKKRVSIAKVLLKERGVYLMDEPTSNLDPLMARQIRDMLLNLGKKKIVLYSSHNLYEAKEIGTYLILIRDGYVKFFDKIEKLRPGEYRIGIKASGDVSQVIPALYENGYYVTRVRGPEEVGEIIKKLVEKGITITEVKELDNPLEDLFKE
jgi:ABC-2 type transport system ATP-binding protein